MAKTPSLNASNRLPGIAVPAVRHFTVPARGPVAAPPAASGRKSRRRGPARRDQGRVATHGQDTSCRQGRGVAEAAQAILPKSPDQEKGKSYAIGQRRAGTRVH